MGKFKGQTNKCCFTLNNYTHSELEALDEFLEANLKNGRIKFAIVGEECGVNGVLHLQGYIRYDRKAVKARAGCLSFWRSTPGLCRGHFEVSRGTDVDNQKYCSKDAIFKEYGNVEEDKGSVFEEVLLNYRTKPNLKIGVLVT